MSLPEKKVAIYNLYEHTKNKLERLDGAISLERKDGLSEGDTAHNLLQRILLQHLEGTIVWKLERGRKAEHFMLVCRNQIEVTTQKRKKLMKLAKRAKRDPPLVRKVLMNNYAAYCLREGKKVAYEEFVAGDLLRAVTDVVDEEDGDDEDSEDVDADYVDDNDDQQEHHHDVPSDERITKGARTVNEANGDEKEENVVEEDVDVDDEGNYILDEEEVYDVDDEEDCYEFNQEIDNADEVDDDYFDDDEDYILEEGKYHDADSDDKNDDHEDDGNYEENDDEDGEEIEDAVAHDDNNDDDKDDDGDDDDIKI